LTILHADPPSSPPSVAELDATGGVIVAVPARDEEARIAACLDALAAQEGAPHFSVLLLLNNCLDRTRAIVESKAASAPFDIMMYDIELPVAESNAATARRLAMNAAARRATHVLTSDADSRVGPDWVAGTMAEFATGVDLVCGFVTPDTDDQPDFDSAAIMRGLMEFQYTQATAELISLVCPDPLDPWPNHLMETGASLAITAECYVALGGVPKVSPGEDRAMADIARRHGRHIRHSLRAHVVTSSRISGRAHGGWSADLAARLSDPSGWCHELIEPARMTYLRAALRGAYLQGRDRLSLGAWAKRLQLAPNALAALQSRSPNEAWAMIEAASPVLTRRRIRAAQLPAELTRLTRIVDTIRTRAQERAGQHHRVIA
jgi:hypothetical protein